ncbi:hypothetical protein GCM10009745_59620 [Kribbella yunnanensis]|uniref:Uncharacterized protein n=1 Tax=Kribbella yunnanensis TaxID=190194 RepID=A0ABN2IFS1_9ACTN
MNKLDGQLPGLMARATDGLEPESVDLVERSLAQGVRLRRRRSTAAGVAAGGAVLVTMGLVVAGFQHFDHRGDAGPMVAGPPVASTKPTNTLSGLPSTQPTKIPKPKPGGPTLATLRSLLKAPGRTLSAPESWGSENDGFFAAASVVDDGKGKSQVQVLTQRMLLNRPVSCKDLPGCTMRPDGSTIRSQQLGQEGNGIISNFVEITRKDGRFIGLTSYNAAGEKDTKPTRTAPILSVAQLTELAESKLWTYPAKASK